MANTLGSLVVKLGLDAAEFTSGLTKSEYAAKKFTDKLDSQFKSVARTIASLGAGAAIGLFVRDMVSSAAALDDLSDATGSSVESLSKLANQAKISGRDFGELQSVMLKLSAGMAGADDESSNTGRALKALGVTARDPAEALQQIAIALNKYADGVGKAAIARDLFGKSGPAFLATLKDIAETQDVAATTSAKMAADAEALEKALRRLTVEGTALKDAILSGLVPWLNTMLEQFREGIKLAGGFGEALRTLGTINPFKTAAENIADYTKRLEALKTGTGAESFFSKIFGTKDEVQRQLEVAKAFEQMRQRQQAMAGTAALGYTGDVRDYQAGKKPALDYTGRASAAGNVRSMREAKQAVADYTDEIQKLKDAMDPLAQMYPKLTAAQERIMADMHAGKQILWDTADAMLRQARAADENAISAKAAADAWKVYEEEQARVKRAQDAFTDSIGRYAEENDALKREIGVLGEDDAARQKLAATLEYERLLKQGLAADDTAGIAILKEQYAERLKLIDAYNQTAEALRTAAEYNHIFADSFADALTSAADGTKSLKDAFKDMTRSIVHDINQIAAQNISRALFGVNNQGGGGIGALIASFLGGGAGPNFGSYATGPGMAQLGGPGGGLAGGTDYWRGGPTWVGERGPEILNLPAGSQVIPSDESRRMAGTTNVYHINVMPGASSASVRQTGDMLRDITMKSMRSR